MSRIGAQSVVDQVLERAEVLVAEIERRSEDGSLRMIIHSIIQRLDNVIANLRRLQLNSSIIADVVVGLVNLLDNLQSENPDSQTVVQAHHCYMPSRMSSGHRGQPSYNISNDQLNYLLFTLNLSVPQVAQCLGISTRTIRRRMSQYGMSRHARYSSISDQHLDYLVGMLIHRYPNSGYRMMLAHLRSLGIIIQERRMRSAMLRVNPVGVSSRWSQHRAIHRRVYSVAHPNALWHIDGNHSLSRWGFYVHGGVDGYSRVITFLSCSLSNTAERMVGCFVNACLTFGVPSRVRSDHGAENFLVAQFMLLVRGLNRGSHITGCSIHNQRIERMWRDVFTSCLSLYYRIFYYLEDMGILNPDDQVHRFALQAIFQPRIDYSLRSFQNAWNNHSMSSANGSTPLQLMVMGLLTNAGSGHTSIQEVFSNNEIGNNDFEESDDAVSEGDVSSHSTLMKQLRNRVNPMAESSVWGIDLYVQALQWLNSYVRSSEH